MKDEKIIRKQNLEAIKECIIDYTGPIYIVGIIDNIEVLSKTIISATISKDELVVINNKYPKWLEEVLEKSTSENNILVIKDFEKISTEEQKLFIDIICKNYVSSEQLPENLKIIIIAEKICPLISDIREVIQYFEI